MSDVLLGAGHRQIVIGLHSQLSTVVSGDVQAARVLVLTGPSGAGKSRIIREFFRGLQSAQPQPGYWPELPEPSGTGPASALQNRKIIGPPIAGFVWPPNALPSFTWWDFNCDRMQHGDAVDVIAQAAPAINAHQLPALLAWRRTASTGQRLGSMREDAVERIQEVFAAGGSEAAGLVLDAMGLAIPGWGLLADWLKGAGRAVGRHRSEQRQLATTQRLGAGARQEQIGAAVATAELLLSCVNRELPAIVVVEDIHLMGAELGRFLDTIQSPSSDRPVLIIGTAWHEGHQNEEYAQWRDRAKEANNLAEVPVPQLPGSDLASFVLQAAPETDPADIARLVDHFPNPLVLQLFLSLGSTRRRIARQHGALHIDLRSLQALDNTIRGLYQSRWEELPAPVQQALSHAAASLPEHMAGTWPFTRKIVNSAAVRSGFIAAEQVAEQDNALQQAGSPFHWTRRQTASVESFLEPVLDDIARTAGLDDVDRQDLQEATLTELRLFIDAGRGAGYLLVDDPAGSYLVAARWLWALLPATTELTPADSVAVFLIATTLAQTSAYTAAVALLQERDWLAALPVDHPDTLTARHLFAAWLARASWISDAVGHYRAVVRRRTEILGANHADTLRTQRSLALLLGDALRYAEAVTEFRLLITTGGRALPTPDPRDPPNVMHTYLDWYRGDQQVPEMITAHQLELATIVSTLGWDHVDARRARVRLITSLRIGGRTDEALSLSRDAVNHDIVLLGPDHPDTFEARSGLALVLGEAGETDEAMSVVTAVLADQARLLGEDHDDVQSTRHSLAALLARAGLFDEAIAHYELLAAANEKSG